MLAVALALASSVVWGTADFLGGVFTRRLTLAPVLVVSQLAGLVLLAAAAAITGEVDTRAFAIGLAGGALLPVVLALAQGERPGAVALAGCALALAGAVLASVHEYAGAAPNARSSVLLAATAALGIGGFLYCIGHAVRGGHTLPALLGSRSASLALLVAGVLATQSSIRLPPREIPAVAGIGLLDVGANALFAAAAPRGYLSIVSVLGSEYPVVTVILAQTLLGERVSRPQAAGITLALIGVGIVSLN